MSGGALAAPLEALRTADLHRRRGRVRGLIGLVIEAAGLRASLGELCAIEAGRNAPPVAAEVVGFRDGGTLLMPLGPMDGIGPGTLVCATGRPFRLGVGPELLGRVLDGLGTPIDGLPAPAAEAHRAVGAAPPPPLRRARIGERLSLGVRALDGFVPCGTGQRLGIFAGSGVGKSSLLGMIARSTSASVNVICLVGERGREVREFVERDLGEALERSVVVVATSDQPALVRIKAALVATTVAEWFRDRGEDVLLMMDSLTRLATAQRELGLAIGEPPAARGFTPSVFALLPRLLERAGTAERGSITGLYTVLVEADDLNDPVADAARSILDGHCVLARELAHRGHYPAVDVLQSVSRLAGEVTPAEVREAAAELRELLAVHRQNEDLIAIGAYAAGTDARIDRAIALVPALEAFLRQPVDEHVPAAVTDGLLLELAAAAREPAQLPAAQA
ncbi:MAG TPA: FliI/YscN family ATPase [Gaiellaceae bacterium]|nr:FliI/YscN family ATPase [Gaiellaceae bacterium]